MKAWAIGYRMVYGMYQSRTVGARKRHSKFKIYVGNCLSGFLISEYVAVFCSNHSFFKKFLFKSYFIFFFFIIDQPKVSLLYEYVYQQTIYSRGIIG